MRFWQWKPALAEHKDIPLPELNQENTSNDTIDQPLVVDILKDMGFEARQLSDEEKKQLGDDLKEVEEDFDGFVEEIFYRFENLPRPEGIEELLQEVDALAKTPSPTKAEDPRPGCSKSFLSEWAEELPITSPFGWTEEPSEFLPSRSATPPHVSSGYNSGLDTEHDDAKDNAVALNLNELFSQDLLDDHFIYVGLRELNKQVTGRDSHPPNLEVDLLDSLIEMWTLKWTRSNEKPRFDQNVFTGTAWLNLHK